LFSIILWIHTQPLIFRLDGYAVLLFGPPMPKPEALPPALFFNFGTHTRERRIDYVSDGAVYFFALAFLRPATVRRGPRFVRALVLVRCP